MLSKSMPGGLGEMAGAARRILKVLRERARSRHGCISIAVLAAKARMTPSEVRGVLEELESRRLVTVSGDRVCYTGLLDSHLGELFTPSREVQRVLQRLGSRRDIVSALIDARGSLPYVDYVVVRRDGTIFLVRVVDREPPERLVSVARKLARIARRVAEGEEQVPGVSMAPRKVVPVLLSSRGAPRLIEGVLYRPAEKFFDLVLSPEQDIGHPLVRVYERREG